MVRPPECYVCRSARSDGAEVASKSLTVRRVAYRFNGAFDPAEHALLTAAHTFRFGLGKTNCVVLPLTQNRELLLARKLRMMDDILRL